MHNSSPPRGVAREARCGEGADIAPSPKVVRLVGAADLGLRLVVKDDDLHRTEQLAGIRRVCGQLKVYEAMVFADAVDLHQAKAVEQWLAQHPRFTLLVLPTYCPRAKPIERAFGDVHDLCTRHHTPNRLRDLVVDVEEHLRVQGPWEYKLSELYYALTVTAAVEKIAAEEQPKVAS